MLYLVFWGIDDSPYDYSPYVLSATQVFASKYLTELHLIDCEIGDIGDVLCSNLRSLKLFHVSMDDVTFKYILIGCPLIEHLNLSFEGDLPKINASEVLNLKTLIVEGSLFGESDITSSVICGPFLNLRRLELRHVNYVDDSFFKNITSSFPKLEDLTLEHLCNHPTFKISSHSITNLSLNHLENIKMAELDVPNIKNFKFSDTRIPPLSFITSSKEWKSEISLDYSSSGILDLSKLREFLIKLGQSKITLCLTSTVSRNVAPNRNIEIFHLPAIEELILIKTGIL